MKEIKKNHQTKDKQPLMKKKEILKIKKKKKEET